MKSLNIYVVEVLWREGCGKGKIFLKKVKESKIDIIFF